MPSSDGSSSIASLIEYMPEGDRYWWMSVCARPKRGSSPTRTQMSKCQMVVGGWKASSYCQSTMPRVGARKVRLVGLDGVRAQIGDGGQPPLEAVGDVLDRGFGRLDHGIGEPAR